MGWVHAAIAMAVLLTAALSASRGQSRPVELATSGPSISAKWDEIAASLGPKFKRYHSTHFEILSDCDASTVRRVLDLAEDTFRGVSRFTVRMSLPHSAPANRLPLLLFERYAGFEKHARRAGFPASEQVPGYFDEAAGVCVTFNFANAAAIRVMRDDLWRRERTLASLKRGGEATGNPRTAELERELEAFRREIDAAQRAVLATVVRHEIAHQVLCQAGIQSAANRNRRWLTEGLAMLFENADGPNEYRSADALAVAPEGRLDLLRRVVSEPQALGPGAERASQAYAAAWALVYYLAQTQPRAMASYLTSPPTADAEIDSFERRFGEINASFAGQVFELLEEH